MMNSNSAGNISVTQFYSGKSVLVTGFTGFIGKLVVEKLLWSCPHIDKIYVLLRRKRELSPQDRLDKIIKLLAFDRVRDKYPGALESKLVAVDGDLSSDGLGLSDDDRKTICQNVHVVIHSAASVRFDDTLDVAVQMNMIGTKRMLDLALEIKNLMCFLHVSTAYSNCDKMITKETLYDAKCDWKSLTEIVEKVDNSVLQTLSPKIMDGIPNTYIFTKGLTEHIVNDYRNRLPIAIVRPSLVVPTCKEPVAGWIDNPYGPLGINVGFITGITHCGWGDPNGFANYIYADFVVNSIILAAYKESVAARSDDKEVKVYNACSPPSYKCTHNDYMLLHQYKPTERFLNSEAINYFNANYFRSFNCFRFNFIYRHMISALIIDLILVIAGKSPMLTKVRRNVFIANKRLKFFIENSISFEVDNFMDLPEMLNESDRRHFGYDFSCNMKEVYYNAIVLSKQVLLKPLFKNIQLTRKVLKWLYVLDTGAVIITYSSFMYILYRFILMYVIKTNDHLSAL